MNQMQCVHGKKTLENCIKCVEEKIKKGGEFSVEQLKEACGIPCIVVSSTDCKKVLKLLREAKWHNSHHSRLVLTAETPQNSDRAYQVSEHCSSLISVHLRKEQVQETLTKAQQQLLQMLEDEIIQWDELFQPQQYIVSKKLNALNRISWLPLSSTIEDVQEEEKKQQKSCHRFFFSDLFAGIGGFHLALKQLGGECILASEVCPEACALYKQNFESSEMVLQGSIKQIAIDNVPQHDIMTGGFPCQSFSTSGSQRGLKDPRGMLFWHIVRLALAVKPKSLLLENVTGLVIHNGGSTLSAMLASLSEIGYSCSFQVFNSKSVVPQSRERVYIVCIRNDIVNEVGFRFNWPEVSAGYINKKSIQDILEPTTEVSDHYTLTDSQWRKVSETKYFHQHPEYRLPPLDGIANTLRSSYRSGFKLYSQFVSGNDARKQLSSSICPPRFFTPRECARLQGFPDSYNIKNTEEGSLYRAIGNAVTPPLIEIIAGSILQSMKKYNFRFIHNQS